MITTKLPPFCFYGIAYRRSMGLGKPVYRSFWLSSLIRPSLTERCSKSCVTCISFQLSWLDCLYAWGRAVMPCSRRTSSFMVDWLGLPFNRMKPLLLESWVVFERPEWSFDCLDVPNRLPNIGIIWTTSGFSAGVEAHTMARLTSSADQ
jgi:hypothetical protein